MVVVNPNSVSRIIYEERVRLIQEHWCGFSRYGMALISSSYCRTLFVAHIVIRDCFRIGYE